MGNKEIDPNAARPVSERVLSRLKSDKAVRIDLADGGRVHIDRPLPFICVHELQSESALAAPEIAAAHASYLITSDLTGAVPLIAEIGAAMKERFGGFLVLSVGELESDQLLTDDSPYLPPFEILVSTDGQAGAEAAARAFIEAVENVKVRYRSPRVSHRNAGPDVRPNGLSDDYSFVSIKFAPIYQRPNLGGIYPDLLARVISNTFDALLQGFEAFASAEAGIDVPTHRALGRRVFIDTVRRVDEKIEEVCGSFEFLPAVTPINAEAAWAEFKESDFSRSPRMLYRPLTTQIDVEKRRLFSIPFEHLEDPVLTELFREKQFELDLQLTMLDVRDTPQFREISRVLYGPVEPSLLTAANEILEKTADKAGPMTGEGGQGGLADCTYLKARACEMIEDYRSGYPEFDAKVEIRDDLPAGMMVSGPRLMISSSTHMSRSRVDALLSHEIGVHLLTYFAGDAQGLRLFRSGLSGYEGVQEGLAVFAEYLAGGMTLGRLRLIAGRVVGCAAMLDGAEFPETFRILVDDHGFSKVGAFNLALRLYRSGGLAKDAIYLRGLLQILEHLKAGGSLDPFWMGKISASHFVVMEELRARGLLKPAPIRPKFMSYPGAPQRLKAARAGLSPAALIAA